MGERKRLSREECLACVSEWNSRLSCEACLRRLTYVGQPAEAGFVRQRRIYSMFESVEEGQFLV